MLTLPRRSHFCPKCTVNRYANADRSTGAHMAKGKKVTQAQMFDREGVGGAEMTKRTSPPVRRVKAGARPEASPYERIGAEKVERLVAAFYARVASDPVIRPLYGKTLTCAIRGLTDFMISWLDGPPVYDVPRARLRRRHAPFVI